MLTTGESTVYVSIYQRVEAEKPEDTTGKTETVWLYFWLKKHFMQDIN